MRTHLLILVAMAAVLVCATAPTAQAQTCSGYGWGGGYGYLYNSLDYNVPYFAAHPPVYYSYPVPRTYGYSPFAYPPSVMTPDVVGEAVAPLEIINPYVPSNSSQTPEEPKDRTTNASGQAGPLVIINPYVTSGRSIASAE
jgi:hypothetical protein